MARRGDFELNRRTLQQYLDGAHGVEGQLEDAAQAVASAARANAAVDSGEYRDSIHVETDHTDRMVKRVVADAPHSLVVEARDGTLSTALDAAR